MTIENVRSAVIRVIIKEEFSNWLENDFKDYEDLMIKISHWGEVNNIKKANGELDTVYLGKMFLIMVSGTIFKKIHNQVPSFLKELKVDFTLSPDYLIRGIISLSAVAFAETQRLKKQNGEYFFENIDMELINEELMLPQIYYDEHEPNNINKDTNLSKIFELHKKILSPTEANKLQEFFKNGEKIGCPFLFLKNKTKAKILTQIAKLSEILQLQTTNKKRENEIFPTKNLKFFGKFIKWLSFSYSQRA